MASGPITSWQIDGETMETVTDFILRGSKITADGDCSHKIKRHILLGRKALTNLGSILKSRDFTDTGPSSQSYGFPVVMYGCESWTIKKAECWRIDAFEPWCWGRLLSPLDCKEVKPVNPKIFIGRTDAKAETPILWPPDGKNWLIRKYPDAGKDWQEKGTTEDEMVGWHHQLDGHEFEQVPGVGDGQGSLVCCSLWGHKESAMTKWLNWTELNWFHNERRAWGLLLFIKTFNQLSYSVLSQNLHLGTLGTSFSWDSKIL